MASAAKKDSTKVPPCDLLRNDRVMDAVTMPLIVVLKKARKLAFMN